MVAYNTLQSCIFDLCETDGDEQLLIQSVDEYAYRCQVNGYEICDWRVRIPGAGKITCIKIYIVSNHIFKRAYR